MLIREAEGICMESNVVQYEARRLSFQHLPTIKGYRISIVILPISPNNWRVPPCHMRYIYVYFELGYELC